MASRSIPRVMERGAPNAVTYDLTTPQVVRITLPPDSTWTSGLHWHETHTEYLQVVRGSIRVRVGDETRILSAGQPEVRVDKYVWHEWQRADAGGEEAVVLERTDPADGQKALFFWNLNGVILRAPAMMDGLLPGFPEAVRRKTVDLWVTLNLFVIFAHLDNVPVFVDFPASWTGRMSRLPRTWLAGMDWFMSHLLLLWAKFLGRLVDVKPVRAAFTPDREYAAWIDSRSRVHR